MKPVRILTAAVVLTLTLAAKPVSAVVVDATVTELGGGSFLYEVSVLNDETEDLAIVSLADAPPADPLIDPTLTTPLGFLGSYDSGLGFVDFLADTSDFSAGLTVGGFSFESLSGPDGTYFTTFEALDVTGNFFSGPVNITVTRVPEGGGTFLLAGLVCSALPFIRRRKAISGSY